MIVGTKTSSGVIPAGMGFAYAWKATARLSKAEVMNNFMIVLRVEDDEGRKSWLRMREKRKEQCPDEHSELQAPLYASSDSSGSTWLRLDIDISRHCE
jgi:hypothetical protein